MAPLTPTVSPVGTEEKVQRRRQGMVVLVGATVLSVLLAALQGIYRRRRGMGGT